MRGHAAALSVISALDRKRLTAGACPCCKRIAEALRSHIVSVRSGPFLTAERRRGTSDPRWAAQDGDESRTRRKTLAADFGSLRGRSGFEPMTARFLSRMACRNRFES